MKTVSTEVNEAYVKARAAARERALDCARVVKDEREEFGEIHGEAFLSMFDSTLKELLFPEATETKPPTKHKPQQRRPTISDVDKALAIGEEICELADNSDLPSKAVDYAESVSESARGVMATIEESGYASVKQVRALENWLAGLKNWFHDD